MKLVSTHAPASASQRIRVAEFVRSRIDQWEAAADITARTAGRYRELNENQIVPHVGAMLLQKVRPLHVEQWHSDLRDAKGRADGKGGLAPRTIGHAHRVLSSALNDAAENDLVLRNVMQSKSPPKVPDEEMVIVRDVPAFIAEIKASGRTLYVPAMVSLFTGMRRSEVLALKWGRVDLDRNIVRCMRRLSLPRRTASVSNSQNPRPDVATLRCPTFWSMCCATIARRSLNCG